MSPKLDHCVTGWSCVLESGIAARQAADEIDIMALSHTSVKLLKKQADLCLLTEETRAMAVHVENLSEEVKNGAVLRSSHVCRVLASSIA